MSWSPAFVEAVSQRSSAIVYRVQTERIYREPYRPMVIFSAGGAGFASGVVAVSTIGQRLTPGEWTSQLGAFTIDVVGQAACEEVLRACARGTGISVYVGFPGLPDHEWGRVALGVVRDIEASQAGGYSLRLACDDLVTALRGRFDPDSTECLLFSDQPAATTLTAGYTAGDSSITVASATPFNGQTNGLLKMGSFYVRYTWRSGTTVTLDTSVYEIPGEATALDDVSSGEPVYVVAWMSGHPLKLVNRILVSTGAGTHGAQDVLPAEWGLGIPERFVDEADITEFQTVAWTISPSNYEWDVWSDVEVTDAYDWITGWLAPAGGFLAMRQGAITARCAQRPTYSCGLPIHPLPLADRLSSPGWRYSAFYQGQRIEYNTCRVHSLSSWTDAGGDDAATLPAERLRERDLAAHLRTNESSSRTVDVGRLSIYDTRIPELVTVPYRLAYAQRCIGDLVELDTTGIPTRQRLRGMDGQTQLGVVVGVSTDWAAGVCELQVLIYPPDEGVLS